MMRMIEHHIVETYKGDVVDIVFRKYKDEHLTPPLSDIVIALFPYVVFSNLASCRYGVMDGAQHERLSWYLEKTTPYEKQKCQDLLAKMKEVLAGVTLNVIDEVDMKKYETAVKLQLALKEIKR